MAREQHSILLIYKNGKSVDFERFVYKTLRGILNCYKSHADQKIYPDGRFYGLTELFFRDYAEADSIKIYSTLESGKETGLLAEYTGPEFMRLITRGRYRGEREEKAC